MKTKKYKIRFVEDLHYSVVEAIGEKVYVHCLGWRDLIIESQDGEDVKHLRDRVFELIKGTPCGIDDVHALLELTL